MLYICIINNAIIHNQNSKQMSDLKLNPNENRIAVHESASSTKIIRFIDAEEFLEAAELQDNSALHGVYENEHRQLVATDIWGDEHIAK